MMMLLLFLLALVVVTVSCSFLKTSLMVWTGAFAATLLVFTLAGEPGWISLTLFWLLFAAVAIPLNHRPWRRAFITQPVLKTFRKMVPQISETEQVALDAGTVGFEGELFTGRPNWRKLIDQPLPELNMEEQAFLDGPVEELCDMIDEWEFTHYRADLSPEAWEHLKKNKFFGMIIPKEYGGLGFSAIAHRAVLEKVGGMSATAGSVVAVPNSLGPAELLLHYGTDEQKDHYLPRLASGEEIPCFGLTSTVAGSDATSIADYGVVCEGEWEGKKTLGIKLNFEKRYITLAPVATVVGLAFRLYDPDGLIGDTEDIGISVALLPRSTPGLDIGRRHFPLNNPFPNGPLRGKDVFVPLDFLLGGQKYAGQGWKMLIESLSVGRAISLPCRPPAVPSWPAWRPAHTPASASSSTCRSVASRASRKRWPGSRRIPTPPARSRARPPRRWMPAKSRRCPVPSASTTPRNSRAKSSRTRWTSTVERASFSALETTWAAAGRVPRSGSRSRAPTS